MSDSLKSTVLTGVIWNTIARFGQQLLQFGFSVVLARLLVPEDFGLITMMMVFAGFVTMLSDAGLGAALVHKQHLEERHIQTSFWSNVVIGVVLTALAWLIAPWLAEFYKTPELKNVIRLWSVSFIIINAGMVPEALLMKRMRFAVLARVSLMVVGVSGAVGVVMAYAGWGVWSLVVQSVSASFLSTVLLWSIARFLPRRVFEKQALSELVHYGRGLLGFSFINYWARNADSLLIGRAFGSAELGLYGRAYSLMLLPITQVISVFAKVMFPALSSIQNDRVRIKRIYLRANGMIALFSFPLMIGLIVTAGPFINTLYGPKWEGVVPLIRILAVTGIAQSLLNPTGWLYTSLGKTNWLFWWGVGAGVTLIGSIIVGVILGSVQWVAVCYTAANLVLLLPGLAIPGSLIGMTIRDLFLTIKGPVGAAIVMGIVVAAVHAALPATLSSWVQLVILVTIGVLFYWSAVFGLRMQVAMDALSILREKLDENRSDHRVTDSVVP